MVQKWLLWPIHCIDPYFLCQIMCFVFGFWLPSYIGLPSPMESNKWKIDVIARCLAARRVVRGFTQPLFCVNGTHGTYVGLTTQWLLNLSLLKETSRLTWPGQDQTTRLAGIRDQRDVLQTVGVTHAHHSAFSFHIAQRCHTQQTRG